MKAVFFAFLLVVVLGSAYLSDAACNPSLCKSICGRLGYGWWRCSGNICYCSNFLNAAQEPDVAKEVSFNVDKLAKAFEH
ncbi:uncharacterized protein LOC106640923 [Copidosoma floridanum]|uniref:Cysteine-rich peptide 1 n=1 Tax=Copidosoma floridanum TaxID=29053 RepID=Q2Q1Y7_COPFL|nr:uncharacterized protein LOC106640923 [Copidosoma floridanum]ABB58736.1 cysteine-rich peptide 1 [Copidosoma floridanum]